MTTDSNLKRGDRVYVSEEYQYLNHSSYYYNTNLNVGDSGIIRTIEKDNGITVFGIEFDNFNNGHTLSHKISTLSGWRLSAPLCSKDDSRINILSSFNDMLNEFIK